MFFLFAFVFFNVEACFECFKSHADSCSSQPKKSQPEKTLKKAKTASVDLNIQSCFESRYQEYIDSFYKQMNYASNLLAKVPPAKNNVIIIDIDNTAIDIKNSTILPVKAFYDYWIRRGFSFVFLTARPQSTEISVENLLKSHGYKGFIGVICMPDKLYKRCQFNENAFKIMGKWKAQQRKILATNGFEICATLDDLVECLEGGFTGLRIKISNQIF